MEVGVEARVLVPAPAETKEWVCTEARVGAEAVEVETGEGWGGGRGQGSNLSVWTKWGARDFRLMCGYVAAWGSR